MLRRLVLTLTLTLTLTLPPLAGIVTHAMSQVWSKIERRWLELGGKPHYGKYYGITQVCGNPMSQP